MFDIKINDDFEWDERFKIQDTVKPVYSLSELTQFMDSF